MAEKTLLVDNLELHYEGIFDVNELLKQIDRYTTERGYGKAEKRRQEKVFPSGKEFSMELRPTKVKTEYYSLMIKIRISITDLTDVEVIKNDIKTKMNKGNIVMVFDAWAITDLRQRWEHKPYYYILRKVIDKYIWPLGLRKYDDEVIDDTHFLHKNIKAYLNLHKY